MGNILVKSSYKHFPLLLLINAIQLIESDSLSDNCFRASVYEHVKLGAGLNASLMVDMNLRQYERVANISSSNGAHIVVFPELGLFGGGGSREKVRPFLENIPNPLNGSSINPCENAHKYENVTPILFRLSCSAKNNNIYIVAGMGDIQKCSHYDDLQCPQDGFYQYNTAVIFDNKGFLLAKYHKYNLYGEHWFDKPSPQHVFVDTPLGRLSPLICLDLIYKTPAIELIDEFNVDTILFPTHWFDQLPLLASTQFQQSFAIFKDVNLLASNIHQPESGSLGSGIYSGDFGAINYNHTASGKSKLLFANIPRHRNSSTSCDPDPKTIIIENNEKIVTKNNTSVYKYKNMTTEDVKKVLLSKSNDSLHECQDGVCCQLNYRRSSMIESEKYYFIVANRPGVWWELDRNRCEQFCALVRCDGGNECKTFLVSQTQSVFERIEIYANFTTQYIFPSVSGVDVQLINRSHWKFGIEGKERAHIQLTQSHKVLTFGLYARCFDRDPVPANDASRNGFSLKLFATLLMLTLCVLKMEFN